MVCNMLSTIAILSISLRYVQGFSFLTYKQKLTRGIPELDGQHNNCFNTDGK